MYLNPYSILPFTAGSLTLFLGILIFRKSVQDDIKWPMLAFHLSLSTWLLGYASVYAVHSFAIALFLSKLACYGVFCAVPTFYHFVIRFVKQRQEERLVWILYFLLLLVAPLHFFTNETLYDLHRYFFGYYPKPTPLYIALIIVFFIFGAFRSFDLLYHATKSKNLSPVEQLKAKYLLIGFTCAYLAGIDYLPKYGFAFYPFGSIFTIIWVLLTSHAILRHKLFDITIALQKGLVYSILATIVTAGYLIFVLTISHIFQGLVGYQSFVVNLAAVFIIGILFNPLRNWIQRVLDMRFFHGTLTELDDQNVRLRQEVTQTDRLKAVTTLASGMAHEIKNPLTAIKTFTEYLPKKLDDKEFLQKFSQIVGKEVDRIDNLVHELLEFAKPAPLNLVATDLNKLLDETIVLLSSELLKHEIKVVREYDAALAQIKADPNQMKQAFLNIFLNAIEAMPDGGTLFIMTRTQDTGHMAQDAGHKTQDQRPTTTNQRSSDHPSVIITIKDTGKGIDPKDLPHIFDPFFSKKDHGTGLGLSITHEIITNHKGRISVKSTPGLGAAFILEFPLNTAK